MSQGFSASDSLALVKFYQSTNGEHWRINGGWLKGPISNWYGVAKQNGKITKLLLQSNNLTGFIPADIGNLKDLEEIWLGTNGLTGNIPYSIGNLKNLKILDLSRNRLSGGIPTSISNLRSLEALYLSNNPLGGKFPEAISSLQNLKTLALIADGIEDTIPSSIGNLKGLQLLFLAGNKLRGIIPNSIGGLINLTYLGAETNNLEGQIPVSIGQLSKLEHLTLYSNKFTGTIPYSLGFLYSLKELDLRNNQFTGIIPTSVYNLRNLHTFHLSVNNFRDTLPETIGNLVSVKSMVLGSNQFYGRIPHSITKLKNLITLDLSRNYFTFDGLDTVVKVFPFCTYLYQKPLIIDIINDTTMSVKAGGNEEVNVYRWSEVTSKQTFSKNSANDSGYWIPTISGTYKVDVSNLTIPQLILNSFPTEVNIIEKPANGEWVSYVSAAGGIIIVGTTLYICFPEEILAFTILGLRVIAEVVPKAFIKEETQIAGILSKYIRASKVNQVFKSKNITKAETSEEILKPNGQVIGEKGETNEFRNLAGGEQAATQMWERLLKTGEFEPHISAKDKVIVMRSEDGYITWKGAPSYKSPNTEVTIDVRLKKIPEIKKLKFNP